MTTWTAITTHSDKNTMQALGDAIENLQPAPLGLAILEIEDGSGLFEIAGYYDEKPNEVELMLLCAVHKVRNFDISKLDDRDWVAQVRRELTPVRAGRFFVHGRHDAHLLGPSDIGLEIEAAMAFGTGHHGTTLGCLRLTNYLERNGIEPRTIADIGTGTGILAMAAARLWPRAKVLASDIEEIAVRTAKTNFSVNHVKAVRTYQTIGFNGPNHHRAAPFGLIYANILSRPLRRMAPDMARHVAYGGYVILSGILRPQGAGVLSTYREHGFEYVTSEPIGEWVSYLLRYRPN